MTQSINDDEMRVYLAGERLYGNDFTLEQINAWFADEAEGYFSLVESHGGDYTYGYHRLNKLHGFTALPAKRFHHVLGVGAAYGHELQPILEACDRLSILEPSEGFKDTTLGAIPLNHIKPVASGEIPVATATVDLVTCFGVLHHIPNVETVVREFYRTLAPGGYALIREPTISMGDWRKPRVGLTKRERGIPLRLLREMIVNAGFKIVRERKCMFSLSSRLRYFVRGPVFNNPIAVGIDALLCSLPVWSARYHAQTFLQKLRPTSVFYVLQKPTTGQQNS